MSEHDHDHDHEHVHAHDEDCDCGHEHEHHDDDCDCEDCAHSHDEPGVAYVEGRMHDDAVVISGRLTVAADYEKLRPEFSARLEGIAATVAERGGIVGHVKASAAVTGVDMYSVTDVQASVKSSPEQEVRIILAAIVFHIPLEDAEELVRSAMTF